MLEGKVAVVTGAGNGIGKAIALALAEAGAAVVINDIGVSLSGEGGSATPAEEVRDQIRGFGGQAAISTDSVSDWDAAQRIVGTAVDSFGRLDIVVNNAGIHDDAPMAGMSDAQWRRVIDVSVHGFFHVTRPLLLPMARARFGRVISVSSVAAVTGNRGQTNYAAAKAALHGATLSLAREMASRGITANVVAPGIIAGSMTQGLFSTEQLRHLVPAGRAGKPEDVAQMVAFLASDAAGYVNGQIIGVNGGMA